MNKNKNICKDIKKNNTKFIFRQKSDFFLKKKFQQPKLSQEHSGMNGKGFIVKVLCFIIVG